MTENNSLKINKDAIKNTKFASDFEVHVDSNNVERAIKLLKRKLIREGFYKIVKQRKYFEKPSEAKKRKKKEASKRIRKEQKKLLHPVA